MKTLQDRVAVVTGAASGIGRATSIALARQGCNLAISDIDMAGLEQTAAEIRTLGRRVCSHEVDVADKQRMLRYVDEVMDEYGTVHILINNAGVSVAGSFEEQTIEDIEWLLGINVWGVIYGCKFFLPHLQAADEAHIVNISSVFGIIAFPKQTSYCMSKFAVRGLTESLQLELKSQGIGVTSVHPGPIDTNIARDSRGVQGLKAAGAGVLSRGTSPEHAANRIVGAIKRNKQRLLITREAYVADWIKRALPAAAQHLAGAQANRMQRKAGI